MPDPVVSQRTIPVEHVRIESAKPFAEVKAALEKAGINAGRIETISYGKEKPFCEEQSDTCWRMNRRAHIVTQVER